jgi:thiol:disulfide interchange protein DsbD
LRTRWIAGTASFLTIAGAVLFAMPPANSENESAASLEWREWQPGLANQLAEQGQLVYVDFTARWCVTCQTNKAAVFSSSEINDRVRAGEITLLRADWTNRDDRISDALAAFGRSAVPFNLVYGPNAIEQPIQLPELLTPSIVIDAFAKAKSL